MDYLFSVTKLKTAELVGGNIELDTGVTKYEVGVEEVATPTLLISKLQHLGKKTWFTREHMLDLIQLSRFDRPKSDHGTPL